MGCHETLKPFEPFTMLRSPLRPVLLFFLALATFCSLLYFFTLTNPRLQRTPMGQSSSSSSWQAGSAKLIEEEPVPLLVYNRSDLVRIMLNASSSSTYCSIVSFPLAFSLLN